MKKKLLCFILLVLCFMPYGVFAYSKVKCGSIGDVPAKFFELSSYFMRIIEILVPIILVLVGSVDLLKGIASQKEDEIKKGQQTLIKRLILAFAIFFVVSITRLLVSLITTSGESDSISSCIDCFVNGVDSCQKSTTTNNVTEEDEKNKRVKIDTQTPAPDDNSNDSNIDDKNKKVKIDTQTPAPDSDNNNRSSSSGKF